MESYRFSHLEGYTADGEATMHYCPEHDLWWTTEVTEECPVCQDEVEACWQIQHPQPVLEPQEVQAA